MKNILSTTLFIVFFSLCLFAQDFLKIGDKLQVYTKRYPLQYQHNGPPVTDWAGCDVTFYSSDKIFDEAIPLFMSIGNVNIVGVLQGRTPNAYYLFDLDGDSILDTKSGNAIIPYWVISKSSINRSAINNIGPIMSLLYESFQSDEGPETNPKLTQAMREIGKFKSDVNAANRDLAYMFFFYNKYSQPLPEQSLKCIESLTSEYKTRFSSVHPLLLLFRAETLLNLKRKSESLVVITELRKIDSAFIPAMVYEYQFEQDKTRSTQMLSNLKAKYKNHWIVRQL